MELGREINKLIIAAENCSKIFAELAKRTRNELWKNRLPFMASEEELQARYLKNFAQKIEKDDEELCPLKILEKEDMIEVLNDLMKRVMLWEQRYVDAANIAMREKMLDLATLLHYLSKLELTHYQMIEAEEEYISRFEDYGNLLGSSRKMKMKNIYISLGNT